MLNMDMINNLTEEDLKVIIDLNNIRERAEECYNRIINAFTFSARQDSVVILNNNERKVTFCHDGIMIFNNKQTNSAETLVIMPSTIYNLMKTGYSYLTNNR